MALATMETVMLKSGRVHSPEAVQTLRSAYLVFRAGYQKLNAEALEAGHCRWPQRPKLHYAEHWILDTLPLNARLLHNYLNEDMIRRIKLIASKCQPACLSKHVCLKWALQTSLRWRQWANAAGSPSLCRRLSLSLSVSLSLSLWWVCVCVSQSVCYIINIYIYIFMYVHACVNIAYCAAHINTKPRQHNGARPRR